MNKEQVMEIVDLYMDNAYFNATIETKQKINEAREYIINNLE